jgi:molybdopterin/thiamine biosynthesis adenylyltransferase
MLNLDSVRPAKKTTVPFYKLDHRLYIGGSGYTAQIPDPNGSIQCLFDLMDGSRTIHEIYAMLSQEYPEIPLQDVLDAIVQFDRAGFLEDQSFSAFGLLDDYDMARWERNINFLGSFANLHTNKYALQYKLKTARIALLGLGGLGSHLLYDLAALGAQDVRALDFDKIELSNLNRQILYTEADLGRRKTEVAGERVRAFSPRMKLEIIQKQLTSSQDVFDFIQDRNFVICVADRPKTEIITWVNEACLRRGATLISGGLDTQRAIWWTVVPGQTGCIECWHRQVQRDDDLSSALLAEKRRLQIKGDNAAFVPLVALVSGFIQTELVKAVTGIATPAAAGQLMEYRFATGEVRVAERWVKDPDCPLCQAIA